MLRPPRRVRMPWRPLPSIAFAIATYPFYPTSPEDLPLELGDELYIIEQGGAHGSWYRGYLVAPPSLTSGLTSVKGQTLEARVFTGIFPRNCVDVREELRALRGHANKTGIERIKDETCQNETSQKTNGDVSSRKSIQIKRCRSNGKSLRAKRSILSSESRTSNGDPDMPIRSLSRSKDLLANGEKFKRSISHRSIASARSRRSEIPPLPALGSHYAPRTARPPAPVPMLKIGDETPSSISEPLIDEIASCLREWHSTNLHELLLSRQYSTLDKVSDLIRQLDLTRRQLLHGILTAEELQSVREKAVWDLIQGNKMLSDEIIVRDPRQRGRLLTCDDSPIEMSKLQSSMSVFDKPSITQHDPINLYHLMVDVKSTAIRGLESATLILSLCSKTSGGPLKPLTEAFAVDLPYPESFDKAVASGKMRTLFTDISPIDIRESTNSDSRIYLVIEARANQVVKPAPLSSPAPTLNRLPASTEPAANRSTPSLRRGRKSLAWAQKQLGGSIRRRGPQTMRGQQAPSTADAASFAPTDWPSTASVTRPHTQQGPQYVKRDVAMKVIDVKQLLVQGKGAEEYMTLRSPVHSGGDVDGNSGPQDDINIRDQTSNQAGRATKKPLVDNVHLQLRAFASPDADHLIADTPTLLHNIAQTQRLGFSRAPTQARSDIYVTIFDAHLSPQAVLAHPERGTVHIPAQLELQNTQLTVEVRKSSGQRIENCIFPTSNSVGLTAWRTTAVERGEAWNQTIKLVIPAQDVPDAHLIMSIADAPAFPFALGWMPLWDEQAFLKDGSHSTRLYLYDEVTSNTESGRGAYQAYPWSANSNDEVVTGPVALLRLGTYLCSTEFSQDKVLLAMLKWREQSGSQILDLLRRLVFVPEIEIVKLVNEVFDSLFGILVDHAGKDEYEDLVFYGLATVLGIVHDRRFNLGPTVDRYTETRFDFPFVTPCLIRSYLRLLADPTDPAKSRHLRATFKVSRQILRFIFVAREQQRVKEAGIGITATQPTFVRNIGYIMQSIENLMKNPSAVLVGNKTLAAQQMHTWLPELAKCFGEKEILEFATTFLDSYADAQGKLILYRLVFILNFSALPVFTHPEIKEEISRRICRWIDPYWGFTRNITEQWQEQVRLCCSIVSAQANIDNEDSFHLFSHAIGSYTCLETSPWRSKSSLSLLFPTTYPFASKTSQGDLFEVNEVLTELAAVLAHVIDGDLANLTSYDNPNFSTHIVTDALNVCMSVLANGAFPRSWLSLRIYHHRSLLQMLNTLHVFMVARLLPSPDEADEFDTELWKSFFTAILELVKSDALSLETFPEQKRRAVWKIAGDVREEGADLLKRAWETIGWDTNAEDQKRYGLQRMGGYQVQYVPSLVSPILELCLSVHEGLRSAAVGILQSMIVSEWQLGEDLSAIQAEIVDSLDKLYKSKPFGENTLQKFFITELLDLFDLRHDTPDERLLQTLRPLLSVVDELMDLLGAVYGLESTEAVRILNTLQLMDYLKDMQKRDVYVRYIHQLAQLQIKQGNATEAGLALQLHADLYPWGLELLDSLKDPDYPRQISFERKESLFFDMIKCFEEGSAWDNALQAYRELADQYEHHVYEYAKLARTQHSMAKIYDTIAKSEWHTPRYFRVHYRGHGFPPTLRDRQFIFEAFSSDRLSTFTDQIAQQYPAAHVMTGGAIDRGEGQGITVFPINSYRDPNHPLYYKPRVPQVIRDYILASQPRLFAVTSRRHLPTSGVKDQWVEKTIYETAGPFPNILRRSEIIRVKVVKLSSLQTAVERTSRKTSELAALEKRVRNGEEGVLETLKEAMMSSIDPTSRSSVVQYRELIPTAEGSDHEEEETPALQLQPGEKVLQIALADHAAIIKHCIRLYSVPSQLSTHIALSHALMTTFAPEVALLAPFPQPSYSPRDWATNTQTSNVAGPGSSGVDGHTHHDHHTLPQISGVPTTPRSRLSLAFLRTLPKANGHTPSHDESVSSPTIDGQRHSLKSDNTHKTNPTTPTGLLSRGGTIKASGKDNDRENTAVASKGGVRKRLSIFGIGKGTEEKGAKKEKTTEAGHVSEEEGYP